MSSVKILFIGSVEFSKRVLEHLIYINSEIVGVVTQKYSEFNSDFADLTEICKKNEIPYHLTRDINSYETIMWIKKKLPEVIFCFGWPKLLQKEVLNITQLGVIGYHPSALPMNRGRHPLIWALALGLTETGSTFFFMDEGTDSGDILSQEIVKIEEKDCAMSLYEKIIITSLEQIEIFIPKLIDGKIVRIPQDGKNANYWRKRNKFDGQIDWRMTARSINNLVRALAKPYVGAHFLYKDKEVKVWKVKIIKTSQKNIEPGKVIHVGSNEFTVKCSDNSIEVVEHELEVLPEIGDYL